MQNQAAFWDGIADKYARDPIKDQTSYDYTLERTRSYLHREDRMLELGCGTGSTALTLAPHVAQITATDISGAMISKGRAKALVEGVDNVDFAVTDAAGAPDGPFEVITAFNLLHLVEDLDATLAEITNRLTPGGHLITKTFCIPTRFNAEYLMMKVMLPVLQMFGRAPFVAMMHARDYENAMTHAGLTIVETTLPPTKDARRYIVARKPA